MISILPSYLCAYDSVAIITDINKHCTLWMDKNNEYLGK